MCNKSGLSFCSYCLPAEDVVGKDIIEVGSYNVNGSVRDILLPYKPKSYLGVDMSTGPYVDRVCNVYDLEKTFGAEAFDIVITTEMMEHVFDWRKAIHNLKAVCRPNGHIIITTRSKGFPLHNYPEDYWRFEIDDMVQIFADCQPLSIAPDTEDKGVFVHALKLPHFYETDLSNIKLYSITLNTRIK